MKATNKKTITKKATNKKAAVKTVAPVAVVAPAAIVSNAPKYPFNYIAPESLIHSYMGANYLLRDCSGNLNREACDINKHKPAVATTRDMNFYNDLKRIVGTGKTFYQFNYTNENKTQIKKFDNGNLSRLFGLGFIELVNDTASDFQKFKLLDK